MAQADVAAARIVRARGQERSVFPKRQRPDPHRPGHGGQTEWREHRGLPVVTNGLDRALLHGVPHVGFLFLVFGLLAHVGVTFVLVTREVIGGRLPAQIAVDAVAVHVPRSIYAVGYLVS